MKYLGYKIFTSTILLIGLTCLAGCFNKEPDCGCNCHHNYVYFGIPYEEGDVVKFTDSIGNKLVFTLKKSVYGDYIISNYYTSEDCGQQALYNQYNHNYFEEALGRKRLFIGEYTGSDTIYHIGSNTLCIGIDSFNFGYYTEELRVDKYMIPSITLNGKKYTNVFVPGPYRWRDKQVYYNKEIGIISFKVDSVQWYLDN